MSIKMGFITEPDLTEGPNRLEHPIPDTPRPSLVEVYFPERAVSYTYYNDLYDLQLGDLVFVDGKREGERGRVTQINYAFKIKLSDYKRVIYRAETRFIGALVMAGSHFITDDPGVLSFSMVQGWLMPPSTDEMVCGTGDDPFPLDDLPQSGIPQHIAARGHDYFSRGRVLCIEKTGAHCRALVEGSRIYTVEWDLVSGMVCNLTCDCYCPGRCKHQLAALLQLQESLDAAVGMGWSAEEYLMVVSKPLVYETAIMGRKSGEILFS